MQQANFLDLLAAVAPAISPIPQATAQPITPGLTPPLSRQERFIRQLRAATAPAMQCKKCRRDLWITTSGYLVCSDFNCGRLLQISDAKKLGTPRQFGSRISDDAMREAWPERVISKTARDSRD